MIQASSDVVEDKKTTSGIVDYLQAPKKKKKNYVITAFGNSIDKDFRGNIEVFLKKNFPQLGLSQSQNIQELKKFFSRDISLLIIDDHFLSLDETLDVVFSFKEKKGSVPSPVLFLTEDPSSLIQAYQKKLIIHQEVDNYIPYRNIPLPQIYARIQTALQSKESRRSRRFKTNIPIKFFHLSKNKQIEGEIIDISLHGAVLKTEIDDSSSLRLNDQLKLHLPSSGIIPTVFGEFLRISAKVRRLFLSGDKFAISWEHISADQHYQLTRYVTEMVNRDMYLKSK